MTASKPTGKAPAWAIVGLILVLFFDVAWRWHTIGPTRFDRPFEGWLVRSGETEPLDCDEAAYAYIGRRILRGDVLYRDLTENKPPLGYWLYTLAVAIGGANELTIRLMPIPYILATIVLVWWIALKLSGPATACLAALIFAVADTDPYVFGNGSNMEHFLNFFSVASLALMVRALRAPSWWALIAAGACVGLAALVKQVGAVQGLVYAIFVLLPRAEDIQEGEPIRRPFSARLIDAASLALGFLIVWIIGLGVVIAQGAGASAYEDIVRFARAMTTDLPPSPNAPPLLVRWLTGNADPQGKLPWPFGSTDYYVWWGAGLWPLWLASVPATIRLGFGDRTRQLLAAWVVSAWLQILLPGMYWQHYYLLAVPGAALAVSIWLADTIGKLRVRPFARSLLAIVLLAALGWTVRIQVRDYLGLTPDEITSKFKGGKQWVALRGLGRELAVRAKVWEDPHLFVWGWQSPLFIYSGLDGVSRHFFANELLKAHANDDHPLIRPWIDEILRDLRARPPAIVFAGDIPFPALRRFLDERYLPSMLSQTAPDGRGFWVEKERYREFHAQAVRR
jgi:4-amino-4-deoxy-L-arabinose transferase-like glycosyltransferase